MLDCPSSMYIGLADQLEIQNTLPYFYFDSDLATCDVLPFMFCLIRVKACHSLSVWRSGALWTLAVSTTPYSAVDSDIHPIHL